MPPQAKTMSSARHVKLTVTACRAQVMSRSSHVTVSHAKIKQCQDQAMSRSSHVKLKPCQAQAMPRSSHVRIKPSVNEAGGTGGGGYARGICKVQRRVCKAHGGRRLVFKVRWRVCKALLFSLVSFVFFCFYLICTPCHCHPCQAQAMSRSSHAKLKACQAQAMPRSSHVKIKPWQDQAMARSSLVTVMSSSNLDPVCRQTRRQPREAARSTSSVRPKTTSPWCAAGLYLT